MHRVNPFLRVSGSAILLFLGTAIVAGIIGNRADALFILLLNYIFFPLWNLLVKSVTPNSWPLITIIVLLLVSLALVVFLWWRSNRDLKAELDKQNSTLDRQKEMILFDDILLYNLSKLGSVPLKDREEKMKDILRTLLKNAVSSKASAGHVHRGAIFLPFPERTGEELKIWAHYQMDDETIKRTHFYIGDDTTRERDRGIAGRTFKDGKIYIGHMIKENDIWICKEHPNSYINFEKRLYLPYTTLVSVPIRALALNSFSAKIIGVVCFDSIHPTIFDSAGTQDLLELLGKRIGAILSIYWQLSAGASQSV